MSCEMDVFIDIVAVLCGIIGIVGSILPGLPGVPVSWIGMMVLYFWGDGLNGAGEPMSLTFLLVWLGIVVVVSVLDYVIPAKLTKVTGGTKYASRGAIIGLFAGMILTPIGMILGSFLGAFLGELIFANKNLGGSLKAATGSFFGFILGTGMKIIVSGVALWYIIVYLT